MSKKKGHAGRKLSVRKTRKMCKKNKHADGKISTRTWTKCQERCVSKAEKCLRNAHTRRKLVPHIDVIDPYVEDRADISAITQGPNPPHDTPPQEEHDHSN